jgi:hypothetical protein
MPLDARNGGILNFLYLRGRRKRKSPETWGNPEAWPGPRHKEKPYALRRGIGRDKCLQSFDQLRDVAARNLPCPMDVNLKIVMDHNISEAHDFSPRNLRMGVSEFWRDALGCLTEHSTLKKHGVLVPAAVEEVQLLQPT